MGEENKENQIYFVVNEINLFWLDNLIYAQKYHNILSNDIKQECCSYHRPLTQSINWSKTIKMLIYKFVTPTHILSIIYNLLYLLLLCSIMQFY